MTRFLLHACRYGQEIKPFIIAKVEEVHSTKGGINPFKFRTLALVNEAIGLVFGSISSGAAYSDLLDLKRILTRSWLRAQAEAIAACA